MLMKTNRIGLALALALTLNFAACTTTGGGGRPLSSPHGKASQTRIIAGETTETMDRSFTYGSPRALSKEDSLKAKAGTTRDALKRSDVGITAKVKSQRNTKASDTQLAPAE